MVKRKEMRRQMILTLLASVAGAVASGDTRRPGAESNSSGHSSSSGCDGELIPIDLVR